MRDRADIIRFAVVFLVLSILLGWLLSSARGSVSYALDMSMTAVAVVSAMLASVGFTWRRKLTYAALTFGLYLLPAVAADLAGFGALARQQLHANVGFPSAIVVLYSAWMATFPFGMLVLFVGRRPSLLWSRKPEGRVRPSRAQQRHSG